MRLLHAATIVGVLTSIVGAVVADDAPKATTWSFDAEKGATSPAGFTFGRTGEGKEGKWLVLAIKDAPSGGNVLAQTDPDSTDYRFPVAIVDVAPLADVALSVKCKPVSGKVDQACGLVLRYQDANNYYVTRANALEGNVRFYYVKNGRREQLKSWSGKVKSGVWHDYKVEAKGDHFVVMFDGKQVLDVTDKTFAQPGKVGVWTKADSVTYFDDLKVEPR